MNQSAPHNHDAGEEARLKYQERARVKANMLARSRRGAPVGDGEEQQQVPENDKVWVFLSELDNMPNRLPDYASFLSKSDLPEVPPPPMDLHLSDEDKKVLAENGNDMDEGSRRFTIVRSGDVEDIVHQGWLTKDGRVSATLKKRWFVLQGGQLKYFEKPEDVTGSPPKAIIALDGAEASITSSPFEGERTCMLLSMKLGTQKLYFFGEAGKEQEDAEKWVRQTKLEIAKSAYRQSLIRRGGRPSMEIMSFINDPQSFSVLDLSNTPLLVEAVQGIVGHAAPIDTLKTLVLDNCHLCEMHIDALVYLLSKTVSLVEVSLCRNSIGPEGITAIIAAISSNEACPIKVLKLNDNQLGDVGIRCLADALCGRNEQITCFNVEEIHLNGNGCSDDGIMYLCEALKTDIGGGKMPTFNGVIVANNGLTDASVNEIAAAAMVNTSITHFDVSGNALTSPQRIVELLKLPQAKNQIAKLNMASNPLSTAFVCSLLDSALVCTSLKYLNLSQCNFGGEAVSHISRILARDAGIGISDNSNNAGNIDGNDEDSDLDEEEMAFLMKKSGKKSLKLVHFALSKDVHVDDVPVVEKNQ